jgi:WD40 repeat protein
VGIFDAHTLMSTIKPRQIAVAWDLSLVLSANGLSLMESTRVFRKEAPLAVRFSEAKGEFVVMLAKTAVVVDAHTGQLKKQYDSTFKTDVTACAMDSNVSKLVVGDSTGSVGLHRVLNLNRIADGLRDAHEAEVTEMLLDERSSLIISASSDRSLRIYNCSLGPPGFTADGLRLHSLELLRSVEEAHEREITTLAFSHRFVGRYCW